MASYLTKSKYKLGRDCPTKLYYANNKDVYQDSSLDDPFLQSLARGGFQVGELAKIYNPGGLDIVTLDHDQSIKETNAELAKDKCTIYEAAIRYENLFIRVDVLRKKGNRIDLVEVKAKSIDPNEENPFWNKTALKKHNYSISKGWEKYIYDVAFQTYVMRKAFPDFKVVPYLMLADKSSQATIDGFNQLFKLVEENGRTSAVPAEGVDHTKLGDRILTEINVSFEVEKIINDDINTQEGTQSFEKELETLSDILTENSKPTSPLSTACKSCEFRTDEATSSKKSGFHECWEQVKREPCDLNGPFVYDIWNYRGAAQLMEQGVYLARDIQEEDINPSCKAHGEFSNTERQWEQVDLIKSNCQKPSVKLAGLSDELASWKYPLHFIDFETTMVALPFNKGLSPYEQIAFQFSHHKVSENGEIVHAGEYINQNVGQFPNFDFVRALKQELDQDDGSIFRYATHENTVLCQIYDQLIKSDESDKNELCEWIKTITKSRTGSKEKWLGERNMIDMCDTVKKYYYHPLTNGSNSIKKVLPAILQESEFLQDKYGSPIYGTEKIMSRNFQAFSWIQKDASGVVKDPYKLLPSIFDGVDASQLDLLMSSDELADGGAAMTAYAKMQFCEMSDVEREMVTKALLKYCELDTLAMVMIWEYWDNITKNGESLRTA